MQLHALISVTATVEPDVYIAEVDITDTHGNRYITDYGSRPDDTYGLAPVIREAVEQWIADGKPVAPFVPLPEPVPQEISRRQFYQGLAVAQKISQGEALAAIQTGTIPAAILAIVNAIDDEDAKFDAMMHLAGSSTFNRSHPLVMVFAASEGMTDEDVDDFWRLCASLV